MNYTEVLKYMFESLPMYQRLGQAAYKADLNNTVLLDTHFEHPHSAFKTIHIAGTNGKGSVSHSIASILQESGYKIGLYTSPHLVDYRERIRVDGKMISENFVCNFINENIDLFQEIKPSFFEMSVALAFEYFKYCKVDIAVIEVGMGGRLDSTNIINPILSIITNIGLDHTQFLGNSLKKIALEKAGIIKHKTPVIIGETQAETEEIFKQIAKKQDSPIEFADKKYTVKEHNDRSYTIESTQDINTVEFDLTGEYQQTNLLSILATIDNLRSQEIEISEQNLAKGLAKVSYNTGLRGRWEILDTMPLVICDTGHNKEGLSYTIDQILSQKYDQLHIILGFVNDKNIDSVLGMFPDSAIYYFTKSSVPRAMDENELKLAAQTYNLKGNAYSDVDSAWKSAKANASKTDFIFIGGSTFIVGDLLADHYSTSCLA